MGPTGSLLTRLITLALLCAVSGTPLEAQRGNRCEWAECGSGTTPEVSAPGTPLAPSPTVALPICSGTDRARCREECRSVFDAAHHECVSRCLDGRCAPPAEPRVETPQDARACLEIESTICGDQCRGETSARLTRCRYDCLTRRCPEASRAEAVEESSSPGTLACRRCEARHERQCGLTCRAGGAVAERFPGLLRFGCLKACLLSSCSGSCGAGSLFEP